MATEKQILANRRNAQLSTGPRTEAGRNASRLNALRHGLTGQIDVRTPDEQAAHDNFCASIVVSLAPAEGIELQFAQSIAEDHWRLNKARSIENNIFTLAESFQGHDDEAESPEIDKALASARTFVADPARFQLLTIYERRIHSNMTKSMNQLLALQALRRAAESKAKSEAEAQRAQAFEEACLLFQLAEYERVDNGQALSPQSDQGQDSPVVSGFVFSASEITQSIHRAARLKAARELQCTPRGAGTRACRAGTHPGACALQ